MAKVLAIYNFRCFWDSLPSNFVRNYGFANLAIAFAEPVNKYTDLRNEYADLVNEYTDPVIAIAELGNAFIDPVNECGDPVNEYADLKNDDADQGNEYYSVKELLTGQCIALFSHSDRIKSETPVSR